MPGSACYAISINSVTSLIRRGKDVALQSIEHVYVDFLFE